MPYSEVPYGMEKYKEEIGKKEPTKQEIENERLKAQIFFNNWEKSTRKQFENKR